MVIRFRRGSGCIKTKGEVIAMWVSIKDKDLYAIVGQEVANGDIDTGLWTKAVANSGGNDAQAKSLYLKMRVLDLSNQRDTQQKQLQQRAKIEEQQRIEQDKQQALDVKQQEQESEDAEWGALPWWKKFFKLAWGVIVLFFAIGILLNIIERLFA